MTQKIQVNQYLQALFLIFNCQTPAQECIVVEDSTYGIQAAKAAGIITYAKKDTRFHYEQNMADAIIEDLSQIMNMLNA